MLLLIIIHLTKSSIEIRAKSSSPDRKVSKILVGMDESEYSRKAFELACFIAAKCNASLLIANITEVIGTIEITDELESMDISKKAEKELERGGNLPLLDQYHSEAKDAGITDVKTLTTSGHVAEMILKIADLESVDMIVLGSRGLHAPKEFLLGSVSNHVSHHAKCTVIIVK